MVTNRLHYKVTAPASVYTALGDVVFCLGLQEQSSTRVGKNVTCPTRALQVSLCVCCVVWFFNRAPFVQLPRLASGLLAEATVPTGAHDCSQRFVIAAAARAHALVVLLRAWPRGGLRTHRSWQGAGIHIVVGRSTAWFSFGGHSVAGS